jgi:hypothetical protein
VVLGVVERKGKEKEGKEKKKEEKEGRENKKEEKTKVGRTVKGGRGMGRMGIGGGRENRKKSVKDHRERPSQVVDTCL